LQILINNKYTERKHNQMYKASLFAVLVAAATASVVEIAPEQWLKAAPQSLVKMQLYGQRLGSTASSVSWSECDSQRIYDVATGTAIPNPPNVGSFVSLNLDIIFNNDANVVGNYINVAFTPQGSSSPIPLYAQDFPSTTPGAYGPADEYTDSITWLIPSFAPLGHYHAEISVHGANKDTDKFACLVADFDIRA
jgi:hypothetical protein